MKKYLVPIMVAMTAAIVSSCGHPTRRLPTSAQKQRRGCQRRIPLLLAADHHYRDHNHHSHQRDDDHTDTCSCRDPDRSLMRRGSPRVWW